MNCIAVSGAHDSSNRLTAMMLTSIKLTADPSHPTNLKRSPGILHARSTVVME